MSPLHWRVLLRLLLALLVVSMLGVIWMQGAINRAQVDIAFSLQRSIDSLAQRIDRLERR